MIQGTLVERGSRPGGAVMSRLPVGALVTTLVVAISGGAHAAPPNEEEIHLRIGETPPKAASEQPGEPSSAESPALPAGMKAADRGAFLSMTLAPRTDLQSASVTSGYDGARRAFAYQGAVDAHVIAGFSARAGFASHDLSGRASALLGARWQFLQQERHGLDVGVGLFYLPQDIEGEGQVIGHLSVGRHFGSLGLFANAGYGQDPEGDDHMAQAGIASLYRLSPSFLVGIDGRMRALLLTSDAKHIAAFEPKWDVAAGPLVGYSLGPAALTGQIGVSGVNVTDGAAGTRHEFRLGTLALLGVGVSL